MFQYNVFYFLDPLYQSFFLYLGRMWRKLKSEVDDVKPAEIWTLISSLLISDSLDVQDFFLVVSYEMFS
jgi:hypothetical protein